METDLSISIPPLGDWIHFLKTGVVETLDKYPFIFLGTDWLAFGHIIIALSFLGAVRDPVKNIWGIQVGVIACVILTPWAFIFGTIREIPIFWRLVDSSFGVIGFIPAWMAYRYAKELTALEEAES